MLKKINASICQVHILEQCFLRHKTARTTDETSRSKVELAKLPPSIFLPGDGSMKALFCLPLAWALLTGAAEAVDWYAPGPGTHSFNCPSSDGTAWGCCKRPRWWCTSHLWDGYCAETAHCCWKRKPCPTPASHGCGHGCTSCQSSQMHDAGYTDHYSDSYTAPSVITITPDAEVTDNSQIINE